VPDLPRITGNRAMAGFTASKLLWVKRHEPAVFAQVARVLLPKDHVRLRLTGEAASEMSDSAGTLWLDVAGRRWSPEMLAATDLPVSAMPTLYEGTEATGRLRPELAAEWGLDPRTVVAGGRGDHAAGGEGRVLRPQPRQRARPADPGGARRRRLRARRRAGGADRGRHPHRHGRSDRRRSAQPLLGRHAGEHPRPHAFLS